MAGNQIQVVDTSIKSQPDLTVLKGMAKPVVVVYKLVVDSAGVRKPGKDQLVVNHVSDMSINDIVALQDDLPDQRKHPKGGPGVYRFEITDQETSAKETWQIRLGTGGEPGVPDPNRIDRPGGVSAPTTAPGVPARPATPTAPAVQVPYTEDTVNFGNGYVYNARFHVLTVPDGRAVSWDPSRPLPDLSPVYPSTPTPAPATPFTPAFTGPPPLSPELIELRARNDALAAELVKLREVEQERARREEIAALRASHEKQIAELTTEFKAFTERVSAKPAEDPRVVELERRLADRERDAARDREIATLRSDFATQITALGNAIREGQASRGPDPMMMGLLDYLKSQLAAAQNSALTPEKMLSLQRDLTDRIQATTQSPLNDKMLGLMGGLLDMTLKFREASANLEGGNNGIDWSSILQTVVDRGGTAVAQISQAMARKAQAETAKAHATALVAQRDMRVIDARALPAAAAPAPAAPVAPAAPPKPLTGEAARDALAEKMFKPVPPAPAAAPTAAEAPVPAPVEAPAAPAPAAPTPAPAPAEKKGKGRKATTAKEREIEAFRTLPIEKIRETFGPKSDEEFFGPFMEAVQELRGALPGGEDSEPLSPDDVAQYVLDAREFLKEAIAQNDGKPPLVADFLVYARYDYLFERLVPEAGEQFWIEAAQALQIKRAAETAAQQVKA